MTPTHPRTRPSLQVRRTFETNRLAAAYLAEAYAVLVPVVRRRLASGQPQPVLAPDTRPRPAEGGRR